MNVRWKWRMEDVGGEGDPETKAEENDHSYCIKQCMHETL